MQYYFAHSFYLRIYFSKDRDINFDFTHSRRISKHFIEIDIFVKDSSYTLKLRIEDNKNKKEKDTAFSISKAQYNRIQKALEKIEFEKVKNERGCDGTSCKFKFYKNGKQVFYDVWSPHYDTIKRGLGAYYNVCVSIVELAGLYPKVIE